ncbi:TPA: DUF551 domain-containing protein [Klebsiella variicola subsp. variicola]|nr:DUF551 domain-containing protein [Klebsiella variicola subsp. variicola]
MKDKLLQLRNQLKMGHRISFAEAMLLQRAIDILVNKSGNYPAIPDGYVMVPKEPTKQMILAGQEELESCIDNGFDSDVDGNRYDYTDIVPDAPHRVFMAMLAAAPQSPGSEPATVPGKWIPVSERMPETDGNYWGWWSESKRQGPVWFIKSELQAQFQSSEITHWMPLPAATQEVKSES